jgi:hypothetical protein
MTQSSTSPTWEDIKKQIERTSGECKQVATILAKKAAKVKTRKKFLRGINIVIGGVAFVFLVIIPDVSGEFFVKLISALASITLFADGLLPSLLDEDPPERLQDYAYYIRNYSDKFEAAQLEETTDERRKAKTLILIDLANQNLNNVRTMWTWVDAKIP